MAVGGLPYICAPRCVYFCIDFFGGILSVVVVSGDLLLQEEFLMDVMQFLILRGHNRLIPQGGISEFPEAILNAKRLDLYNLYREVCWSTFTRILSETFEKSTCGSHFLF